MYRKNVKRPVGMLQFLNDAAPGEYSFSKGNENFDITAWKFRFQYVSEKISAREVRRLTHRVAMMIRSQTGTGKSSLVFGVLLAEAKRLGLKVLILVPRTALALQYKMEAIRVERPDIPEEYREYEAGKENCFGDIEVMTYQGAFFRLENGTINPKNYAFVVMDECHYFVQDAAFDRNTDRILDLCILTFQCCRRIYLSATPELVIEEIIEREHLFAQQSPMERIPELFANREGNPGVQIYDFDSNYEFVRPTFFTDVEDIIKMISEDETDEKTLICVDRKSLGKQLEAGLEELAEYIDAELKNTTKAAEVMAMIRTEKFQKKVLIATSFLDVGVNLKDEKLRNVVVFSTSQTHFKQAIGRKRRDGKAVRLFIHIPKVKRLQQMHGGLSAEYKKLKEVVERFKETTVIAVTEIPFPMRCKLEKGKMVVVENELTFKNYILRMKALDELLTAARNASSEEEGLARHLLGWIGLTELYPTCNWLGAKPDQKFDELIVLLEKHVGKELTDEESTHFREEIWRIHNELGIEERWKPSRIPYVDAINRFLKRCNIPFHVEAANRCIRVKRG